MIREELFKEPEQVKNTWVDWVVIGLTVSAMVGVLWFLETDQSIVWQVTGGE